MPADDGTDVVEPVKPAVREGLDEGDAVVWVVELLVTVLLDSTQRTKPLLVGASVWVMAPA